MKNIKILARAALVALSSLGMVAAAEAASSGGGAESTDRQILQTLGQLTAKCAQQPYKINRNGRKVLKMIKSHCDDLLISADRVRFRVDGRAYTVLIKESEYSDGGDLNDVYLQTDSSEEQEVELRRNVLAFGDPLLAVLLTTGQSPDSLPQTLEPEADSSRF